jgi:hypothetical protein
MVGFEIFAVDTLMNDFAAGLCEVSGLRSTYASSLLDLKK